MVAPSNLMMKIVMRSAGVPPSDPKVISMSPRLPSWSRSSYVLASFPSVMSFPVFFNTIVCCFPLEIGFVPLSTRQLDFFVIVLSSRLRCTLCVPIPVWKGIVQWGNYSKCVLIRAKCLGITMPPTTSPALLVQ